MIAIRAALVGLCAITGVIAVPFEYGTCNDSRLAYSGEAEWASLDLSLPFVMNGNLYTDLKMSSNGMISLHGHLFSHSPLYGIESPFIAPLWQTQTLDEGAMFWRTSEATADRTKVSDILFEMGWDFMPEAIGIVTWSGVSPSAGSQDKNSYQAVLATDGLDQSYVIFYYMDLAFSSSDAVGGFNDADGTFTPARYTGADMKFLQFHTNSRFLGRFVYKTSGDSIEEPVSVESSETCFLTGDGVTERQVGADSYVDSFGTSVSFSSTTGNTDPCKYQLKVKRDATGIYWVSYSVGIHKNVKKYYRNIVMDTTYPDIIMERGKGVKSHPEQTPYVWKSATDPVDLMVEGNGHSGWLAYSTQCPLQLVFTPGASDMNLQLTMTDNQYYANPITSGLCV